jgi:succinate-semialdehyde dehydrogenase/glutarate-semialdehyde dehydrogenase
MTDTLQSLNPLNGDVVGELPVSSVADVAAAVARAREALPAWRDLGVSGRRDALAPAGQLLADRAEEIGLVLTREMGKPLADAKGEVSFAGGSFVETLDELAAAFAPEVVENERIRSTIYHEPFGVCAAITPWNFPLLMPHWLVLPALMAGNTVVLKPSEETPLTAHAYAEALQEVLPPGVLEVVHGADEQGKALVAGDVDLVAFTGSRDAGKHILKAAADDLKRVILELGGKDPMLVLVDADVEEAAAFAAKNSFRNAGQVCVSTERIYVDEAVAEPFVSRLAELTAEIRVGDGTEEGVTVGPMINARQVAHVKAQVDEALAEGATLRAGSGAPDGNVFPPTLLTGVTHAMGIMREETFGPVACVMTFSEVDDAVRLANDTPYGLGAVVFGGADAESVARRIEAGMVGVNRGCGGASGTPWVGAKQSGYGYHSGVAGHRQFTVPRVVTISK